MAASVLKDWCEEIPLSLARREAATGCTNAALAAAALSSLLPRTGAPPASSRFDPAFHTTSAKLLAKIFQLFLFAGTI